LTAINAAAFGSYFEFRSNDYNRGPGLTVFDMFIIGPIAAIVTLGPFVAPIFMLTPAQQITWNHGCDNYPFQIVLSAKAYRAPVYEPNTATYFRGNTSLYTYDTFQSSANLWSFDMRTINSPDLAQNQSSTLYPSISKITYNFVDHTILGSCTSPSSNMTSTCFRGSFNLNNYLSFKLMDLRSNSTIGIRAVDKKWTFYDSAPSVLLIDGDGGQILRTDVTKSGDCTQLKVCAAHDNGISITVPIGMILLRQMEYAIHCTTPKPTTITVMPPSPSSTDRK